MFGNSPRNEWIFRRKFNKLSTSRMKLLCNCKRCATTPCDTETHSTSSCRTQSFFISCWCLCFQLVYIVSFFLSISLFYRRDEQQRESSTHHRTSNMEFTLRFRVVHRQIENSYSRHACMGQPERTTHLEKVDNAAKRRHIEILIVRNLRIEIDRAWNCNALLHESCISSRTWQFTQKFATSLLSTSYYSRFSIFTLLSYKLQNEVTVLLRCDIAKFFCANLSVLSRNISPVRTYRCYQLCRCFAMCMLKCSLK